MSVLPPDDAWAAWTPMELTARLSNVPHRWYVAGGWALDLWRGQESRAHEDLEFCVHREAAGDTLSCLTELRFAIAAAGTVTPLDDVHALPPEAKQIWCYDPVAWQWRVDMMISPGTASQWAYKREPALTVPWARAVGFSKMGIPYLHPVLVLLFKAKHARPKDTADFHRVVPELPPAERDWLNTLLARFHPGHAWRDLLRDYGV